MSTNSPEKVSLKMIHKPIQPARKIYKSASILLLPSSPIHFTPISMLTSAKDSAVVDGSVVDTKVYLKP
jgi:hypothetical protein